MNVLQAIRWRIEIQEEDVTHSTINNCWVKSRVLNAKYGPQTREKAESLEEDTATLVTGMTQQICDLARQNGIAKAMSTPQFPNPEEKEVYDTDEVKVDDIINM